MNTESNAVLHQLFEGDQRYRYGEGLIRIPRLIQEDPLFVEHWAEEDRVRQAAVQEMLDWDQVHTVGDYHRAATIFQHGDTLNDAKMAFELSLKALNLGQPPGVSLIPRAYDKYIIQQQRGLGAELKHIVQHYGCQFTTNKQEEIEYVYVTDGAVMPEELLYFAQPDVSCFIGKTRSAYYEAREEATAQSFAAWEGLTIQGQKDVVKKLIEAVPTL